MTFGGDMTKMPVSEIGRGHQPCIIRADKMLVGIVPRCCAYKNSVRAVCADAVEVDERVLRGPTVRLIPFSFVAEMSCEDLVSPRPARPECVFLMRHWSRMRLLSSP